MYTKYFKALSNDIYGSHMQNKIPIFLFLNIHYTRKNVLFLLQVNFGVKLLNLETFSNKNN